MEIMVYVEANDMIMSIQIIDETVAAAPLLAKALVRFGSEPVFSDTPPIAVNTAGH